ncbi:PAS-domain containing protein [Yoonia sediminilitoris]|uniref:histidine kinase n=1 Tax=Yoonia sediminilitoris TaxID=1286148 RepID=A0A2T6KS97_9RHOB|nr:PAS-domain containing protein [Yoonia sediminilitoris]PUB19434.1 signal transduction histidine kinase [Yoonia sediminilitoris]RCW99602.1 signal transduction histidine kinase [Yoonia sediminilitoris]
MIDRSQPLAVQVERQDKIIQALIERANQRHELGRSAYALFQSAVMLQSKVSQKTRDLEDALYTLGRTNTDLETSEEARNQTQQSLTDALESMDGGFALFAGGQLRVCNDFFKTLIPDVSAFIQPGLSLDRYLDAVTNSNDVSRSDQADQLNLANRTIDQGVGAAAPFVFALKDDRWFVISYRQTSRNNTVVLQTEVTAIVRSNRLEKDRLIDAQEHFLKAAFDNMPQGVCTFSADGTLLINNAQFATLLQLPLHLTQVGTSYAQIVEYLNTKALVEGGWHASFAGLMRYLRRAHNMHLRQRHVGGAALEIGLHPLPDGGCIVNVMDVTVQFQTTQQLEDMVQARTRELTDVNTALRRQYAEQARVEEDLRIAKAEVEAAMSSKTRFFAAASHDLLQPINAAKLLISSLGDEALAPQMQDTVQRLDRSFQSMETLLHALLDISRLESVDMKLATSDFEIDSVLRPIIEDFTPIAAEKGLRLDVVPSKLWVCSDRRYLARSVQNLVNNAIQYTRTGRVLVGCRRRGAQLVLEVWDTGKGIAKADQERVFQEFTRVDPAAGTGYGMGLGLSIVQRACAHLGHDVSVRSKPGVGSVFSITLPIVPAHDAITQEADRPTTPVGAGMDLIILLVENDPGVLFAMEQKLESWGASVLACASTKEALQMVADIGMSPDIILADYQLNDGETGVDSILALRGAAKENLPAIMITANQEDAIKDLGARHDFSVLTKPVNLSRLRSLIDWKTRQQPTYYDESRQ